MGAWGLLQRYLPQRGFAVDLIWQPGALWIWGSFQDPDQCRSLRFSYLYLYLLTVLVFCFVQCSLLSGLQSLLWFRLVWFCFALFPFFFLLKWVGIGVLLTFGESTDALKNVLYGGSTCSKLWRYNEISSLSYSWKPKWLETLSEEDKALKQEFPMSGIECWNNNELKWKSGEKISFELFQKKVMSSNVFHYILYMLYKSLNTPVWINAKCICKNILNKS